MILVSSEEELFELEGVLEEKKVVMGGWKRLRLEDMVVVVLASWDAIMRLVNGDSKKFTEFLEGMEQKDLFIDVS